MKAGGMKIEYGAWNSRSVLDCGGPPPLSNGRGHSAVPPSARGLAQSKTCRQFVALLYFCFLLSAPGVWAAGPLGYTLNWYKVSGGGGTSTNGTYQVSGTIGQHDASGAMTGGGYSMVGGFWALYAVQTPGAPVLAVTYAGNQAVVSWPTWVTGWTLQTNSNLGSSSWGNYLGTVVNNSVTNSRPQGKLFFRLTQ